jgi:hypothetical protein
VPITFGLAERVGASLVGDDDALSLEVAEGVEELFGSGADFSPSVPPQPARRRTRTIRSVAGRNIWRA